MSGPVRDVDAMPGEPDGVVGDAVLDVLPSHEAQVGDMRVRRALPRRAHRTVGSWCFADHMGPAPVTEDHGIDIGPHPHTGLQTVTWLLAGEVLHRDSLGSEQIVRAGELNLMTAGHGVAHSEEATGRYRGDLHGIQLWVAQPSSTRDGAPAFEHHDALPSVEVDQVVATVVVGEFAGAVSPARRDTDHVGVQLQLHGAATLPLRADHEYALIVLAGAVEIGAATVEPGTLAYLGDARDELTVSGAGATATAMLLGGVPFPEELFMSWNFVARTREEVEAATRSWNDDDGRFGTVASPLARIPAPVPRWISS
jgi:redox-sensitive bicupin YhaK (pirin superfamily)